MSPRSHTHLVLGSALMIALGCSPQGDSEQPVEDPGPGPDDAGAQGEAIDQVQGGYVGRELPPELTGELRDPDGRIVVLAPGFVAASAGVDSGAPSYLWFLAVRCTDEHHCEVLTEVCEGSISGEGDAFTLALAPIEGTSGACKDYSGTFTRAQP